MVNQFVVLDQPAPWSEILGSPLFWIPVLPLLTAAINGLLALTRLRAHKGLATFFGLAGPGVSMVLAASTVWDYVQSNAGGKPVILWIWRWVMLAGEVRIDGRLLLDPLSAVMISVVTGIGFLIHLYSSSYMHHEEGRGYARYFAFLNLFMFSMLVLLLGDSLPLMFVGWEGVGLCSYLLIGFFFDKDFAHAAGKKAFVVNRIGDFGFLVGAFLLWSRYGHFEIGALVQAIGANPGPALAQISIFGIETTVVTVAALCLFLGAAGKSAQIPLYVWLPDAMAGPTPVSALIHAATMVTAGVYMLTRLNLVFRMSPTAMLVVAVIGCATALLAATIALVQNDIKKVLAYSTVSQLGYMFLGCGVGAFTWGMFHVFTHAFFKACLFLGSGSVIHAMGGEQDIQKMGGLRKKMPITWITFLVSTIAIAGVPFFAGFFSKDAILAAALAGGHPILFWLGIATAGLTAFYMFRLTLRTFTGEFRGTHDQEHHLHESPWQMTLPLVVLGIGAIGAGYLKGGFAEFLAPIFPALPSASASAIAGEPASPGHALPEAAHTAPAVANDATTGHDGHGGEIPGAPEAHGAAHILGLVASIGIALAGIAAASKFYLGPRAGEVPSGLAARYPALHRLLWDKWRVDELYEHTVIRAVRSGSHFLWKWIDTLVIDGLVNVAAFVVEITGDLIRFLTTGRIRDYAFAIAFGALALAVYTLGIR